MPMNRPLVNVVRPLPSFLLPAADLSTNRRLDLPGTAGASFTLLGNSVRSSNATSRKASGPPSSVGCRRAWRSAGRTCATACSLPLHDKLSADVDAVGVRHTEQEFIIVPPHDAAVWEGHAVDTLRVAVAAVGHERKPLAFRKGEVFDGQLQLPALDSCFLPSPELTS